MCVALPEPAVAQFSLPGCALAAATKSCTVLYLPGGVIRIVGIVADRGDRRELLRVEARD